MKLITQELAKKLPKLYETEHDPVEEKTAIVKLFHPASNWTWYAIEFDGDDLCWGLVNGHESEFGYFSLSELSKIVDRFGLGIERDIFFRPTKVKELAAFSREGLVY